MASPRKPRVPIAAFKFLLVDLLEVGLDGSDGLAVRVVLVVFLEVHAQ